MDKNKGQKIIAAIYLVTRHLSDSDPIKLSLRQHGLSLLLPESDTERLAQHMVVLLKAAALAGLMSEKNVLIITEQVQSFSIAGGNMAGDIFETTGDDALTNSYIGQKMSYIKSGKEPVYNQKHSDNKSKRQDHILTFIKRQKSVGIKDISQLFSEVSEKTIQRELSALVKNGMITKRGSKRWSLYMAVGA